MGGQISSFTSQQFPCQICGTIFKREFSGSLLCQPCRIVNQFGQLQSFHKEISILSHSIYPRYEFVKDKKPFLIVEDRLESGFCSKDFWKKIKDYFQSNHLDTTRNKFIKQILIQLDKMGLFSKYKGIYFHTLQSNDLLFIHSHHMKDEDRIIHLNLDTLEKNILQRTGLDE